MKVYVTTRFNGAKENEIEELGSAVRAAGMDDFNFVRDMQNDEHTFSDPEVLWASALTELEKCDALLIDISDSPTGGRIVELGMAFALKMPIFVIYKNGIPRKDFYSGIADLIIEYKEIRDISAPLRDFLAANKRNT